MLTLAFMPALQVYACIPVEPNPRSDAVKADAIFFGILVAEHTLPGDGPLIESKLIINPSAVLKGFAPSKVETIPGCGDYYPDLKERVLIVRRGKHFRIHKTGGAYEQALLASLRTER